MKNLPEIGFFLESRWISLGKNNKENSGFKCIYFFFTHTSTWKDEQYLVEDVWNQGSFNSTTQPYRSYNQSYFSMLNLVLGGIFFLADSLGLHHEPGKISWNHGDLRGEPVKVGPKNPHGPSNGRGPNEPVWRRGCFFGSSKRRQAFEGSGFLGRFIFTSKRWLALGFLNHKQYMFFWCFLLLRSNMFLLPFLIGDPQKGFTFQYYWERSASQDIPFSIPYIHTI